MEHYRPKKVEGGQGTDTVRQESSAGIIREIAPHNKSDERELARIAANVVTSLRQRIPDLSPGIPGSVAVEQSGAALVDAIKGMTDEEREILRHARSGLDSYLPTSVSQIAIYLQAKLADGIKYQTLVSQNYDANSRAEWLKEQIKNETTLARNMGMGVIKKILASDNVEEKSDFLRSAGEMFSEYPRGVLYRDKEAIELVSHEIENMRKSSEENIRETAERIIESLSNKPGFSLSSQRQQKIEELRGQLQ